MGGVCPQLCGAAKKETGDDGDIPRIDQAQLNKMTKEQRWSYNYPFYRIHTDKLHEILNSFSKLDLTFQEISQKLTTPAWRNQFEEGQATHGLLSKLPGCSDTNVSYNAFMGCTVLFSEGTLKDKAEALFQMVNPPGEA